LVDIDGDALPDRVFCHRRDCFYNPNLGLVGGAIDFADQAVAIDGLGSLFRDRSVDFSVGPEAHVGQGSFYTTGSFSITRTLRYLSDVNADGFVDVVEGSNVRFTHGGVAFNGSSDDTPVPIGGTTETASADLSEDMAEFAEMTGPVDTLRIWYAPWSGTVRVRGEATAMAPSAGDGFDAAIERVTSNTFLGDELR
jgi:hypothetical protein